MEQFILIVRVSAKLEGGEKNENTREPNIQEVPEPRAQQAKYPQSPVFFFFAISRCKYFVKRKVFGEIGKVILQAKK